MFNKTLLLSLLFLCITMPVSAQDNWQDKVHFMKLLDTYTSMDVLKVPDRKFHHGGSYRWLWQ